ncbi:MAG: glycosyltransferase [Magnetococcales bacterium]|nr:glycosyltransferase [Magnetococcales bacterium]
MMRILFIITGLSTGGAEIMLLKLIEHLDRSQFTLMVISLTTLGEIGPRIAALDVPVLALGLRPSLPNPFLFFRLVNLIQQFKPDLVHTWMYHANLLGGLAARMAGVRSIIWGIHNSNLSIEVNKRLTLAVVRANAWLSDWLPARILSCSKIASDVHMSFGFSARKMVVIPNGFDLQCFAPDPLAYLAVRQELGLASHVPLIGLIGRWDPQKNHMGFAEVARLVHQKRPDANFLLAGSGVDRNNITLWSTIEQAGLNGYMHLLGRRDDVPRLMAALDILVSTSIGEAFPNVLGEAMASEVPCVVTDVGDSVDIVGSTGRVVAGNDMVGLADQLLELLNMTVDARQELGRNARIRIQKLYEIGTIARRHETFYKTIFTE